MVDEHKHAAMVASRRCKSLHEIIAQSPREEAKKEIGVMKLTYGEELISLGITNRISVLMAARRMDTKHNML